jgi:hypothetical protein
LRYCLSTCTHSSLTSIIFRFHFHYFLLSLVFVLFVNHQNSGDQVLCLAHKVYSELNSKRQRKEVNSLTLPLFYPFIHPLIFMPLFPSPHFQPLTSNPSLPTPHFQPLTSNPSFPTLIHFQPLISNRSFISNPSFISDPLIHFRPPHSFPTPSFISDPLIHFRSPHFHHPPHLPY